MNSVDYRGNLAADTDRQISNNIWADCPILDLIENPRLGVLLREDFHDFPRHSSTSGAAVSGALGKLDCYIYQGGGIVPVYTVDGGVLGFSSDGDNEGAALGYYGGGLIISNTSGKTWYEARIKTSTITDTKHGIFCGLHEAGSLGAAVPLATDGTLADKNFLGFHRLEGDGDMLDVVYKADGQTQQTVKADAITLVADTWVKVGFLYDPSRPVTERIRFFKDGQELGSTVLVTRTNMAAATFPSDIALAPCFAVMNATGTTPGTSYIDWWQAAQLYL